MKMHSKASLSVLILCLSGLAGSPCSASETNDGVRYVRKVAGLYENDLYASVREEVTKFRENCPAADPFTLSVLEAYSVKSAIKLKLPDIDPIVDDFLKRYPNTSEKSSVLFLQGEYYFEEGRYDVASGIFDAVPVSRLKKENRLDCIYEKAFCALRTGQNDKALSGFNTVLSLGANEYTARSSYYVAWLRYVRGEYREAIKLLEPLRGQPEYAPLTGALLLECLYLTGDYEKVLSSADDIFPSVAEADRRKAARIISGAAYASSDPVTAGKYLEIFRKDNSDLSLKDQYYSGAVAYSLKNYQDAVRDFTVAASGKDSLGQSADYQCGNAYLMLKNRLGAMESFRRASELDFDPVVTEESLFQYAKLSFDLNRDISAFNSYLERYPSSGKSDEVYSYIAASCLLHNDWAKAVDALCRIRTLGRGQGANLQKAAFFRAMQQCSAGAYEASLENFALSYRHGRYNQSLNLLCQYWNAEALYRTGRYDEAEAANLKLIGNKTFRSFSEYHTAIYNLAYDCFAGGKYQEALAQFEKYLQEGQPSGHRRTEATVRAADCSFMLRDYETAALTYSDAAEASGDDLYPAYQSALCFGLVSKESRKVEILEDICARFPDAELHSTALYELGRTYTRLQQSGKAAECFGTLASLPDSSYREKAYLELGMLKSDAGDYDSAISFFRKVVTANRYSEDAQSALSGMESAYQAMNRPEDFLSYLESVGLSSIKTADEKEQMMFDTAEQLFLAGKYQKAASRLTSFLTSYPDGLKTSQALFYLGESYSALGVKERAASYFHKVMERNDPSFEELSTLYYADICYGLERYTEAAGAYSTLKSMARIENNLQKACVGIMRSRFRNEEYYDARTAADDVLSGNGFSSALDEETRREALYIKAESYALGGDREASLSIFEELSADPSDAKGAEAAYMLVLYAYDKGDFDSVRNRVYALADTGTRQDYWLARCFIVLGDAFAEEDDMEQAEATFRSIADGYAPAGPDDDILPQVKSRLSKIDKMKK